MICYLNLKKVNDIKEIRFIDLFSGIGGVRLGLERTEGFRCVWSNDFNKYANQIYTKRFGEENHHPGDITRIGAEEIPSHDLLCGGFPCQAFSIAGKRRGFQETRGTLFFEICRIAETHRPSMLLLENVKGLLSHDGGRTFATILNSLEELGYWWEYQVLNSKHFGVPQNRERVFIIGHLRGTSRREILPILGVNKEALGSQGETRSEGERVCSTVYTKSQRGDATYVIENIMALNATNPKSSDDKRTYHLSNNIRALKTPSGNQESLVAIRHVRTDRGKEARSKSQKKGQDNTPYGEEFREYVPSKEQVIGTVTTGLNKDALVGYDTKIRRLTPVECERLQGFPDAWTDGISDNQRQKCLGNAVTVNVIEYLGKQIRTKLSLCVEESE